eukprot:TRINITY_DN4298_c0_g1_i2.p1 TRINITY_DN4298_c0_g1~~TRINITY_DN4298_c0_g1_i2.p1  ORF type:complete len:315 (+),score=57.30 TRINITY_DN4298_c0_g1_i2:136-1080(+)
MREEGEISDERPHRRSARHEEKRTTSRSHRSPPRSRRSPPRHRESRDSRNNDRPAPRKSLNSRLGTERTDVRSGSGHERSDRKERSERDAHRTVRRDDRRGDERRDSRPSRRGDRNDRLDERVSGFPERRTFTHPLARDSDDRQEERSYRREEKSKADADSWGHDMFEENNDESLGIDRQRAFHNKSNEDRPFNPNSRSFDNSRPFNNNRNFDNTRTDRRGSFGSQNAGRVNRDDNEARGTGRFQNNRDNNREFGNRDGRPGAPRQFGGNNRFGNRREDRDFPSRPTRPVKQWDENNSKDFPDSGLESGPISRM